MEELRGACWAVKGVVQEHRDTTQAVYKLGSGDYDFEVRDTAAH